MTSRGKEARKQPQVLREGPGFQEAVTSLETYYNTPPLASFPGPPEQLQHLQKPLQDIREQTQDHFQGGFEPLNGWLLGFQTHKDLLSPEKSS